MSGNSFVNRLDLAIDGYAGRLRPTHIALYTVILRHFERNGYPETLPLPTDMVMARAGIMNGKTFRKTISELEQLGLLKVVEKAKNQYMTIVVGLNNLPDHLPDQKLDKQNLPDQKMDRHENLPDQKLVKHEILPDQKLDKQNLPDQKMVKQIEFSGNDKNRENVVNPCNNGHFSDFVTSGENLPDQNLDRQTDIYILYNNNNNNIYNNKNICRISGKNEETKPSKKKEKSCAKKENDDGTFERFWAMYPVERHSNMKYCRDYWYNKLNEKERQTIIDRLPAYIASVSDTKYLKLTEFFFKNQKFRDEAFIHAGINGNGKNGSWANGKLTEVKDLRTSTDYSEAIAKMNYCQRNNIPQSEWKNIDWSKINLNNYKS